MARKGEFTLLMEAASKWPWQVSAVLSDLRSCARTWNWVQRFRPLPGLATFRFEQPDVGYNYTALTAWPGSHAKNEPIAVLGDPSRRKARVLLKVLRYGGRRCRRRRSMVTVEIVEAACGAAQRRARDFASRRTASVRSLGEVGSV